MSEVDSRTAPTRGRSSTRGGRGGSSRGGPRTGQRQTNGAGQDTTEPSIEDQGEIGEMKKQYTHELSLLKDMFPDWTDVDLLFALQETEGDLPTTIDRIAEGMLLPSPQSRRANPCFVVEHQANLDNNRPCVPVRRDQEAKG